MKMSALCIMTLCIMTLSIMTLSIMMLSIMTLSITTIKCNIQHDDAQHYVIQCLRKVSLWCLSFMLNVTNKSVMLSVIMLNFILLNVVAPSSHLAYLLKNYHARPHLT
jgi:hypothetical protein